MDHLLAAGGAAPSNPEGTERLRDGTPLLIRPTALTDRDAMLDFVRRTSRRSMESRFFDPNVSERVVLQELFRVSDPPISCSQLGFALTPPGWELVGHGEYVREGVRAVSAEIAFLVTDAYQGQGVATLLLAHLARVAREEGIHIFRAMVLPGNERMTEVFRGSGFPYSVEERADQLLFTVAIQDEPHPTY